MPGQILTENDFQDSTPVTSARRTLSESDFMPEEPTNTKDAALNQVHQSLLGRFAKGAMGLNKSLLDNLIVQPTIGAAKGIAKAGLKIARTGERGLEATAGAAQKAIAPSSKTLGELGPSLAKQGLESDILKSKNTAQKFGSFVGETAPAVAAGLATGGASSLFEAFAQGAMLGGGQSLVETAGTEKSAKDVAKATVGGAALGGLLNASMYGLFRGATELGKSKGSAFQKELQPKLSEETKAIERGFKPFGDKVAQTTNLSGEPAYGGTYKDILNQAKDEIASKGASARSIAMQAPEDVSFTRSEAMGDIVDSLREGHEMTPARLKTIQQASKMFKPNMTAEELLDARQAIDARIPEAAWENEHKAFLADLYSSMREKARELLNARLGEEFTSLNNDMSTAFDVKRLAAKQMAQRSVEKVGQTVSGGVRGTARGLFTRLIDDFIFNPLVTTKVLPEAGKALAPAISKAAIPVTTAAVEAGNKLFSSE